MRGLHLLAREPAGAAGRGCAGSSLSREPRGERSGAAVVRDPVAAFDAAPPACAPPFQTMGRVAFGWP